jgi:hypothetical protein
MVTKFTTAPDKGKIVNDRAQVKEAAPVCNDVFSFREDDGRRNCAGGTDMPILGAERAGGSTLAVDLPCPRSRDG